MLFYHMLADSSDSFFAAALLSPMLSRGATQRLIFLLFLGDAIASYYGTLVFPMFVIFGIIFTIAAFVNKIFYERHASASADACIVVAIALSFDNMFSFQGHTTTLFCSAQFGLASAIAGSLGAMLSYTAQTYIKKKLRLPSRSVSL